MDPSGSSNPPVVAPNPRRLFQGEMLPIGKADRGQLRAIIAPGLGFWIGGKAIGSGLGDRGFAAQLPGH
jgi:hypothetical protein